MTAEEHIKKYPWFGYTINGEEYLVSEKNGEMGKIYTGKWKHFVKFKKRELPKTIIHFDMSDKKSKYKNVTLCGKTNNSCYIKTTNNINKVTCKFCLEEIK